MLNKIQVIGRLGADPEIKTMPNGKSVCNFTVATSERWKDKTTGEAREETEWHRMVAYDRLADIIGQYLRKGSLAYFEGSNKTRMYEKDGIKFYPTEIQIREMKMLGGREDGGAGQQSQSGQQQGGYGAASQSSGQSAPAQGGFAPDDDIPF